MGKKTKIWLITAACLVMIGCIVFAGAMTMLKWDFTKLSTVRYETNEHEITESFKSISIVTDTADIVFAPSEGERSTVLCYEQEKIKHSVTVNDGALVIGVTDTRKWYEYIGFDLGTPKITVYIPAGEYGALSVKSGTGDVEIPDAFTFESIDISESTGAVTSSASASEGIKIKTNTGSIRVENVSANTLELSVSTGRVTASGVTCQDDVTVNVSTGDTLLTDVSCRAVISSGSTGDISLKNVVAGERFSIERSTGRVRLEGCDAAEIFIETDTGDVTGTLLSDKMFITETDTGRINVPKTITGGRCEITTDTGDIEIGISSAAP